MRQYTPDLPYGDYPVLKLEKRITTRREVWQPSLRTSRQLCQKGRIDRKKHWNKRSASEGCFEGLMNE